MQSGTFLRIEGDLVSLVTEMIDREVSLPDLHRMGTSGRMGGVDRDRAGAVPT